MIYPKCHRLQNATQTFSDNAVWRNAANQSINNIYGHRNTRGHPQRSDSTGKHPSMTVQTQISARYDIKEILLGLLALA